MVAKARDDDGGIDCLCVADIPRLTWEGMVVETGGKAPVSRHFLGSTTMYGACLGAPAHRDMAQAIARALDEHARWSPPRKTWMTAVVTVHPH